MRKVENQKTDLFRSRFLLIFILVVAVKLKIQLLFVPEIIQNPYVKGLGNGRFRSIIQPELLSLQRIQIVGQIRRFIVILQSSLSVKLKVAKIILRVIIIAGWLYRQPNLHGIPINNFFGYGHCLYLKRKIILYFQFVFATGCNGTYHDCQQYVHWH